ncbi:LysR family transcriptional regulator [Psychromonas marina]|uniref:LysR family transcriptional regulator n=1 Tax=Psychromonas marina TaxID=88364 RepID=A0ABQ6E3K8_9GAMM|nr:LysR family transcriptional regulator [Psychromonas marina]GLS92032.1 LysR family transcriptional regulator [Psychromonas marina]
MINQKWLYTFMDLVKTGHFTKTANNLYMTQPGVSQHIKKLENQLQTQLLNRYDKQFELTRAGQLLHEYGVASLTLDQQLQDRIDFDDPYQGDCFIACSGAIASDLYPDFIDYQCAHSGLNVKLEAAPNHSIIEGVLNNTVHIGIVNQQVQHSQLMQTKLGNEPLQLILPKSYAQKEINFETLNSLGFINHPDGFEFVDKVLSSNEFKGYLGSQSLSVSGYVNQLNQILLPVSKGVGYTVLPARAVAQFSAPEELYAAPLMMPVSDPLYITTKRHFSLAARYDWFLTHITKCLS